MRACGLRDRQVDCAQSSVDELLAPLVNPSDMLLVVPVHLVSVRPSIREIISIGIYHWKRHVATSSLYSQDTRIGGWDVLVVFPLEYRTGGSIRCVFLDVLRKY